MYTILTGVGIEGLENILLQQKEKEYKFIQENFSSTMFNKLEINKIITKAKEKNEYNFLNSEKDINNFLNQYFTFSSDFYIMKKSVSDFFRYNYKIGAAKGHENTITVTLGTGVGGGIVVNGRLLRGKSGAAGEVGHLRMREEKRFYCTCGHYDCWEAYASGTGYARIAREELVNYPQDKKTYLHLKPAEEITSYDVLEGVRQNDELSKKIHERWETMVVKGLISLANVFDPDSIVLSGGMADFVNFEKVQRIMDESLVVPNVEILRAQAGNYAGMLGAALLAEERFL